MNSSKQVQYFICLQHFGRRPSYLACLTLPPPPHTHTLSQAGQISLSSMLLTFRNLGIPVAINKTQGPDNVLEFMGTILDSDKMEAPGYLLKKSNESWHPLLPLKVGNLVPLKSCSHC